MHVLSKVLLLYLVLEEINPKGTPVQSCDKSERRTYYLISGFLGARGQPPAQLTLSCPRKLQLKPNLDDAPCPITVTVLLSPISPPRLTSLPCLIGSTYYLDPSNAERFSLNLTSSPRTKPGRCSRTREAPPSRGAVSASLSVRGSSLIKRRHCNNPSSSKRTFRNSSLGTIRPPPEVITNRRPRRASVYDYRHPHRTLSLRLTREIAALPTGCTISQMQSPGLARRWDRVRAGPIFLILPSNLAPSTQRRAKTISLPTLEQSGWL